MDFGWLSRVSAGSALVENVPYVNDVDNEEAIVSGSGGIWETSIPSSQFSYKKNKFLRTKHTENPKHLFSKSSPITGEWRSLPQQL